MGLEADSFSISFSNQYTTRIKAAPTLSTGPSDEHPKEQRICHVMLGHQPAEVIEPICRRNTELGPGYSHLLAYGGGQAEFDKIKVEHKVFIEDPSLRGPSNRMSHRELIEKAWDWHCSRESAPSYLVFTESDLLPLQPAYLDACIQLMIAHDADFGGKLIRDISNTNSPFLLDGISRGIICDDQSAPSCLHALGCLVIIHSRIIPSMLQECLKMDGLYFELMFPTAAAAAGGRLLSLDQVSDHLKHVVYRPEHTSGDVERIRQAGYSLVHPVKPHGKLGDASQEQE